MNPLLQITKSEILERQALSVNAFPDNQILKAIDLYDIGGSEKRRSQGFVKALTPLWERHRKQQYVTLFEKFIEMELNLETFSAEHSSHINHVIQEFLFGYNVLVNCEYIRKKYGFEGGKDKFDSKFGELCFSWMAASLLHDIGYDIEKSPEEEAFREEKNVFWDFMTHRAIATSSLTFSDARPGPGSRIIEDYILKDIKKIKGAPKLEYTQFKKLFIRNVKNRKGWVQYDHGLISAVKYLIELEKLEKKHGGDYVNWPPNRHAALAMALHNFRYKKCNLSLSVKNVNTLIAYLLIVSDEIQEWERERADVDALLPKRTETGRNAKKATDLMGITFKNKHAYVVLNHRLKNPSMRSSFELYLDEKIIMQKRHYPIRVLSPEYRSSEIMPTVILDWMVAGFFGVDMKRINKIMTSSTRRNRLKRLAKTRSVKKLLVPSKDGPIYEIYVDHRIDGERFLTVVFPF